MGTSWTLTFVTLMASLVSYSGVQSQPPPLMDFAAFCNEVATSRRASNAFLEILCRQLAERIPTEASTNSIPASKSHDYNRTETQTNSTSASKAYVHNTTEVPESSISASKTNAYNTTGAPASTIASNDASVQNTTEAPGISIAAKGAYVNNTVAAPPSGIATNVSNAYSTTADPVRNITVNKSNVHNTTEDLRISLAGDKSDVYNTVEDDPTQRILSQPSYDSNVTLQKPNSISKNASSEIANAIQNTTGIFTEVLPAAEGKLVTILNDSVAYQPVEPGLNAENYVNRNATVDAFLTSQMDGILSGSENQLLHFPIQNVSWAQSESVEQERVLGEVQQIIPSSATRLIKVSMATNETLLEGAATNNNATALHTGETTFTKLRRGDIMPDVLNETEISSLHPKTSSNETLVYGRATNQSSGVALSTTLSDGATESIHLPISNGTNTDIIMKGGKKSQQDLISTYFTDEPQSNVNANDKKQNSDTLPKTENYTLRSESKVLNNSSSSIVVLSTDTHRQKNINVSKSSDETDILISNGSVPLASSFHAMVTSDMIVATLTNQSTTTNTSQPVVEERLNSTESTAGKRNAERETTMNGPSDQVSGGNVVATHSPGIKISTNTWQSKVDVVDEKAANKNHSQQDARTEEEMASADNRKQILLGKQNNDTFSAEKPSEKTNFSTEIATEIGSPAINVPQVGNGLDVHRVTNNITNNLYDSSTFIGTALTGSPAAEQNLSVSHYNESAITGHFAANDQAGGILNETKTDMDSMLVVGREANSSINISLGAATELGIQWNTTDQSTIQSSFTVSAVNKDNQRPAESGSADSFATENSTKSLGSELVASTQGSMPVSQFSVSEVEEDQHSQGPAADANEGYFDSLFGVKSPEFELSENPHVVTQVSVDQMSKDSVSSTTKERRGSSATNAMTSEAVHNVSLQEKSTQSTRQSPTTVKTSSEIPPDFSSGIWTSTQSDQKSVLTELTTVLLGNLANVHCEQSQQEFWKNVSVIFQRVVASGQPSVGEITRRVTEVIESYRKESPYWSAVVSRLLEVTSDGQWQQLLRRLVLRHAGRPAAQLRLLSAARTIRAAVRASVSSPECRTTGLHPAKDSCDAFVLCYRAGWLWRAQQIPCPRGSAFSRSERRCLWRPLVDCHDDEDSGSDYDSDSSDSESDSSESEEAPWPLRYGRSLLRLIGLRRS